MTHSVHAGDDAVLVWRHDASLDAEGRAYGQSGWAVRQRLQMPLRLQHCVAVSHLPGQADWLMSYMKFSPYCVLQI